MGFKELHVTSANEIIHIEMHTADNRNTLSSAVLHELTSAFDFVRQDQHARILILSGHGRTFSVGADVSEMDALSRGEVGDFVRRGQAVIQALMRLETPTIAAVNGLALGGGFELALACDMRWAHKRALFGFPECRLGLIPAWGGIHLLRPHLAPSTQTDLLMSGDRLNAETAYRLGLVNRIFEGQDFMTQVIDASQKFVSRDPNVLKALKSLIHEPCTFEQGLSEATLIFEKLWEIRTGNNAIN